MTKPKVSKVLESLEIPKARAQKKWACPFCGSSDALHDYGEHFHCFSCGQSGDGIDLVQEVRDVGFIEAAKIVGMELDRPIRKAPIARKPRRRKEKQSMDKIKIAKLLQLLAPYPHREPNSSGGKRIEEYFRSHGVDTTLLAKMGRSCPLRIIPSEEYWRIKVAEADMGEVFRTKEGRYMPPSPSVAYFYRAKYGWDYVKFRCLESKMGHWAPEGYYPPRPFCPISPPQTQAEVGIIVEGEIDAITAAMAPRDWYPVGIPGAGYGWDEGWSHIFDAPEIKRIKKWLVMGDGDGAGKRFASRISRELGETVLDPHKVFSGQWPEGEDLGSLTARLGIATAMEYAMEAKKGERK